MLATSGTGYKDGPFHPKFDHIGRASLITVFSDGGLSLNLGWLSERETGRELVERLTKGIETELGVQLPQDYQKGYPVLRLEEWAPRVDEFFSLLDKITQHKSKKV